ncbi:MAG TPA: PAS domain S-box protein [Gemmataceae bacterium]|nr:PAS domain S-box protein [Gemmataceae bacterium]
MSDGRLKVLLVEDSQADAKLVMRELRQAGFTFDSTRVETAVDFCAQLELAPDIILSDFNMPQFSATHALELLRERGLDIPFIIISGSIGEEIAVKAIQQGANDYLLKDRLGRLGSAVSKALSDRQLRLAKYQAEAALRESQERARLVVESAPNGLIMVDGDGLITLVNEMTVKLFGYSRTELIGQPVELLVPDRLRAKHSDLRASFFAAPSARTMGEGRDLHGRRKDGSEFPIDISLSPVQTPAGLRVLGAIVDITDRKKAEAALLVAQRRLQHVVATSPAVLFTLAVEGDLTSLLWISENVQHLMGYTVEEALHPNWWHDGVHPEDLQNVLAGVKKVLFPKGILAREYRFRHRDGQYRWVHSELKLVRNEQNAPVEIVGSWSDITERKQLEEQYRHSQKMEAFGQLSAGVAHDFNNLLTIITGYSEMLLSGLARPEKHPDMIREIRKAGNRAASLTRQLLAFSRKQILQPVELNLNTIVVDTEKMLSRLIGEDIDLATALAPDLGTVKADPGQIEQVVMNLVVNARDAMPTGGHLTIETRNVELDQMYVQGHQEVQPGKYVMLAVTDSGCGMDEATRSRAFEPFFTTKEVGKGTGLGLATVHGIIKQSGGSIEVYSELGHGTTFKIYLPRLNGPIPSRKSWADTILMTHGTETILLAEDQEDVRSLASLALESSGYTVLGTSSGPEAVELCRQHPHPIHLLMTDVVMPQMSGRQLADLVVALRPSIKVLYLSGYTDDAVVRHGVLEAGMAFLQKPFTPQLLARKVREVLGTPPGAAN